MACYITVLYNRKSDVFLLYNMLHNRVLWGVLRQVLFNMLCLTFAFPGRPSHFSDDTSVARSHAPTSAVSEQSESLPDERDFDWEDYNYYWGAGDKEPAVNPLAAFVGQYSWNWYRYRCWSCWRSCSCLMMRRCLDLPCRKQWRWVIPLYTMLYYIGVILQWHVHCYITWGITWYITLLYSTVM